MQIVSILLEFFKIIKNVSFSLYFLLKVAKYHKSVFFLKHKDWELRQDLNPGSNDNLT